MSTIRPRLTFRARFLVGVLAILVLVVCLFHRQINQRLAIYVFLRANSPGEEVLADLAGQSTDPSALLKRAWATGKIVHRQLVIGLLKNQAALNPPWFGSVERLLASGARDGDLSVRELALAGLEASRDARLFDLARLQLDDPDPLVRLLGLQYLRKAAQSNAVPVIMRLIDDPDLRVAAGAEGALRRWSGEDYGVRSHLAIPAQEGDRPAKLDPDKVEIIRHGIQKRKLWWLDLQGKPVRLSDFRGKIVLLNFWTTWCTACLAEIPDLMALQNLAADKVAILGISLDGIPDEHGDEPKAEGGNDTHSHRPTRNEITATVTRAVKTRGINYPVLLDSENSVGARFNGGELPTTVIIDAEGRVRRRFIGERNITVFEAMISEAAQPISPQTRDH